MEKKNYSHLKGKKLLVLGGTYSTVEVVKAAKEMGVYVFVTDNREYGEAKVIADESVMISTTDFSSLEDFVKEKSIDGIFTGASEFNIENMIELCERINLPCYTSKELWNLFRNKAAFKNLCKKNGILVPEEYKFSKKKIVYPIIVKPTDASSGRGITVCYRKDELKEACEKAKKASSNKEYIIEELVEGDNVELYYLIKEGEVLLMTAADRYTIETENGSPLPTEFIHPSKHLDEYLSETDEKVRKMIAEAGVRNGVLFIETFFRDGTFVMYEAGLRLNATMEYHFLDYFKGFNTLKMMIEYALTGSMGDSMTGLDSIPLREKASEIVVLLNEGKVKRIKGAEKIKALPYVINYTQFIHEGETVRETGTLDQSFARIKIVADNEKELERCKKHVTRLLKVYGEDRKNLINRAEGKNVRCEEDYRGTIHKSFSKVANFIKEYRNCIAWILPFTAYIISYIYTKGFMNFYGVETLVYANWRYAVSYIGLFIVPTTVLLFSNVYIAVAYQDRKNKIITLRSFLLQCFLSTIAFAICMFVTICIEFYGTSCILFNELSSFSDFGSAILLFLDIFLLSLIYSGVGVFTELILGFGSKTDRKQTITSGIKTKPRRINNISKSKLMLIILLVFILVISFNYTIYSIGDKTAGMKVSYTKIVNVPEEVTGSVEDYCPEEDIEGYVVVYESWDSYIIEPYFTNDKGEYIIAKSVYSIINKTGIVLSKINISGCQECLKE